MVIHYSAPHHAQVYGQGHPACNAKGPGVKLTSIDAEVTCKRCLKLDDWYNPPIKPQEPAP